MTEKSAFQRAWAITGPIERGYFEDPIGGPTMHGITEKVARRHGYKGEMRDLEPWKAEEIAKREYWDVIQGDALAMISLPIAFEVFDTDFNMWVDKSGGRASIYFLQRQLNALNYGQRHYPDLKVDGKIGPKTLDALRAYVNRRGAEGELVLLAGLNSEQCVDYRRQTEQNEIKEDFYYGWLRKRVLMENANVEWVRRHARL